MREWILGGLLALAAVLVTIAAATVSDGAMFFAAGVLLAGWAWLMFGEVE